MNNWNAGEAGMWFFMLCPRPRRFNRVSSGGDLKMQPGGSWLVGGEDLREAARSSATRHEPRPKEGNCCCALASEENIGKDVYKG